MKTLYLAIIGISLTSLLFIPWYVRPIQADNTSGVEIQNIQVLPRGDVTAGHPFTINAALVNNSPNKILVENGACDAPFSVDFDSHVLVRKNDIYCTLQAIQHIIDPGKEMTFAGPYSALSYVAQNGGPANANLTFPYKMWSPENQSYVQESISKSFQFTIWGSNTSQSENRSYTAPSFATIKVTLGTKAGSPLVIAGTVYKLFSKDIVLTVRNPEGNLTAVSQMQPAEDGTFSMSILPQHALWSMKGNYTIAAWSGSQELGKTEFYFNGTDRVSVLSTGGTSFWKNQLSPLQQFRSGIPINKVVCNQNVTLIIKAEDGSPACVRYTTANILIERGWAKKTDIDVADSETTVTIPVNSSIVSNGFTFTPNTVKTVIGTNSIVRWINLDSVANDVTSDTGSFRSGLIEPGYAWTYTFDKPGSYGYHSDIHPWLKGTVIVTADPMANLAKDTGTITMGNRTYYFETPIYSHDAYVNPPQISFHGVTFTLFPTGFRGGLPAIHCGLQGPGLGQYYWVDSKFSDKTHELLHLFAYSPSICNLPIPSMFSTHTNPQAGLAFYDGKMKLLVSTDVDKPSQQAGNTGTTGTIDLQNRTYDFLVLNSTMKGYHNPPLQTVLDGVEFTLLPGPQSGGLAPGCGGTPFHAEAKSSDGLYVPLDIFIPDGQCKTNSTATSLGWHDGLGAGLAIRYGNVMILVSKDENDSGVTQMSLKAYGFFCCGMKGDLLKGNLSSSAGPITDANVTISVNHILMGYAKTLADGCFQFNQWNESKLSNQTNAYLARERASGSFSPFPLTFTALYLGDHRTYFPASTRATSSESLFAVPFPPPQLESTVTPPQVNVTQGSSASIQISVKPMIGQWNITHMNLYLDRLPCGISYEISQASDNNTSSVTHPAVFNVILKAATYSPEGTYFVGMEQNGTNSMVSRDAAGTFSLNVLKTK